MKIGICLSGCGVHDGAEIHEATLALLHVVKNGGTPVMMAPNIEQSETVDHLSGKSTSEKRNVLTESARIARGEIRDMATVDAEELDALIFPGGFGAAKNLSNFATAATAAEIQSDGEVNWLVQELADMGKPLGFTCISPASVAAVCLPRKGCKLTIGSDANTAERITELGHQHINAEVDEIVIDEDFNVVSTPAYMYDATITEVEAGISKLVKEVCQRAKAKAKAA